MRKLLAMCFMLIHCLWAAEESTTSPIKFEKQNLEYIFQNNYLNAEDNLDFFYIFASNILSESHSSMKPSELVRRFKELTNSPEIEAHYLSILASHFNAEESKEVCTLIQNENYLKYRQPIDTANYDCHQETIALMQALVQSVNSIPLPPEANPITQVTIENIDEILTNSAFLILDAYAEWCGPCKALAPIFKELNEEYGDAYLFAKFNIEEEQELVELFQIQAFPTLIFFKEGQEVGRQLGFTNKEKLIAKIQQYFE